MKKRIIAILLCYFLVLTLVGCVSSNSSEIISLSIEKSQSETSKIEAFSKIKVYTTDNIEEYLLFLESFDERTNEILGVTTCIYPEIYSKRNYFAVTYKQLDEPREVKSTGKVSLYRTENKEEYCNF